MVVTRVRFQQTRFNKRLGGDETIYTPHPALSDKEDKNVLVQCAFCADALLMSSVKASSFNPRHLEFIFCSPICKVKSIIKRRDPTKCWIFPRQGFVWEDRMFSFRALCYQLHFNEIPPHSRDLQATCRQKRCANPLHVKKRIRVISFDL